MRRALWATSRWRPTAIARRQKPAKRPCLAGGRPRSSRARFLTSWKARVASGPHLPDSSNASGRKLCLPGSTNGSYSLRLASSLRRAATPTDSYDRCLSTLVKQPASVVVTSRSSVRPRSSRLETAMSGRSWVAAPVAWTERQLVGSTTALSPALAQNAQIRAVEEVRVLGRLGYNKI